MRFARYWNEILNFSFFVLSEKFTYDEAGKIQSFGKIFEQIYKLKD